jgi:hypothetical protein
VHDWLETSACWYVNEPLWSTPLVADGPDSWQRVGRTVQHPKKDSAQKKCTGSEGNEWSWLTQNGPENKPLPEVKVSNIEAGDDSISFDVDRTGVPVMVRVSYFPNWVATGAEGPYRSTPNLMVVVPTSNHVELNYGGSSLETVSYALTALGLLGLVGLFVIRPLPPSRVSRFWALTELDQPPVIVDPVPPIPGDDGATGNGAMGDGAMGDGAKVDLAKPEDRPDAEPEPPAEPRAAAPSPDEEPEARPGDAPGGFAPPG